MIAMVAIARRSAPVEPKAVRRIQGARPTGVREELQELEQLGPCRVRLRALLRDTPGWLVSMVVHLVLLLVLALLALPEADADKLPLELVVGPAEEDLPEEDPGPLVVSPLAPCFGRSDGLIVPPAPEERIAAYVPDPAATDFEVAAGRESITCGVPYGDPLAPAGPPGGKDGLLQHRRRIMRLHTPEGKAISAALRWLAAHQLPDGSWSFDHGRAPDCAARCGNAGSLGEARISATAMALLPFLGAGQTHRDGAYRMTVRRGLCFLVNQMKPGAGGGSFFEPGGRMYSHGLAAIAVCEAYALSGDKGLQIPAQQALNFICYAQDPVGGGWRYEPRQPGDTSVVGWQIMALKSGHLAYLQVPPETIALAQRFLDSVQYESGARYGYTDSGRGSTATTAIGLLCRMYLGWKKSEPALQRGVEWISDRGPDPTDMYYNYYAAQVMRHWDGPLWRKWDAAMKPQLIDSQAGHGHQQGSWYFPHRHAERGGRLYCTAMATMTLEVYYRQMPIYGASSVEDDFPE